MNQLIGITLKPLIGLMALGFSLVAAGEPTFKIVDAPLITFPGGYNADRKGDFLADSGSPLHWDGDTLYVFNSWERPWRGQGTDLLNLKRGTRTEVSADSEKLWLWLESTWKDADGTLYGWVHNEFPNVCPNPKQTNLPATGYPVLSRIGAVKSLDNGLNWETQGFVFDGRPNNLKCDGLGPWYAGGVGDCCVTLDQEKKFFYFFFSSFAPDTAEQGLCIARMPFEDRANPVGKVMIWHQGKWDQPAVGGGKVSPFLPVIGDVHAKECFIYWGPSIHWNTYLNQYVMVVNRTKDSDWHTEGQYILFADRLGDPSTWSKPLKFMDPVKSGERSWYVQIVGTQKGETDQLASQKARLFLDGKSTREIHFEKTD